MKREELKVGNTYICVLTGYKYLILSNTFHEGEYLFSNEKGEKWSHWFVVAKYFNSVKGEYIVTTLVDDISDNQLIEIKEEPFNFDCP